MKINYYEAFDLIAEEAVDLLAEHQSDDSFLDKFSVEDTLSAVQGNMTQKKVVKKRMPMKIRFLIAAVMVLMVAAISFADGDDGAELITDENRHLIGKSEGISVSVYDKWGNLIQGNEIPNTEGEELIRKSRVLNGIEEGAVIPGSANEFVLSVDKDCFVTPEVIASNGEMVIFTTSDLKGCKLEQDEKLIFEVELYSTGKKQAVLYQIIIDGVLQSESVQLLGDKQQLEIVAEKTGEYCISLLNVNSTYLALKQGEIRIEKR